MREGSVCKFQHRWVAGLALISGLTTPAWADGTEAKIEIPGAAIQLTVPMQKIDHQPASQLAIFYISDKATNGVIPNVNVQRQTIAGLEAYQQLSNSQFKSLGWTVLNEEMVGSGEKAEYRVEYTGPLQGTSFHWLAKGYVSGSSIILVTCTTHAEAWKDEGPLCQQALDSVKVK